MLKATSDLFLESTYEQLPGMDRLKLNGSAGYLPMRMLYSVRYGHRVCGE